MGNELAVTQGTGLQMQQSKSGVTSSDIQFPSLQLIQKMSKVVDIHNVKPGGIFDSIENKVLIEESGTLEVMPIFMTKFWNVKKLDSNGEYVFQKRVPFSPLNAGWRYEGVCDEDNTTPVERQLVITWMVLLVQAMSLPYKCAFRGASFQNGKKLCTLVAKGEFMQLPPYGKVYNLTSVKEQNDKGTFWKFDVSSGRLATKEELEFGKRWENILCQAPVEKVVDTTDGDE